MKKIYLIGNAHIDPVWLWQWQDGFSEVLATFRSALDRMKEFSDFKFTSACALYYMWVEEIDPDMFGEIKMRVDEGRWCITGGWLLQPDCNIPCGESMVRQGLISQRYFKEKFGFTPTVGYNVDSFGHSAALPKILKKSGIKSYVFMRPSASEADIGNSLFKWQSDDGSTVTAFRIPGSYKIDLGNFHLLDEIKNTAETENTDMMAFYGVGNHGGGPTIKLIEKINAANDGTMIYSTPDEYFESVKGLELTTVKGELQHHARGCYSVCASVKSLNRRCEQTLLAAEKLCVMAEKLTGAKYPTAKFREAWKNLLFNQFHDILGGCSVKSAYKDAEYLFGSCLAAAESTMNRAMQTIAWNIDTLQGEKLPGYKFDEAWNVWEHDTLGTPVIVFNPHSWEVTMPVTVYASAQKVTDPSGNETKFQTVRGEQTNRNGDIYRTAFTATVPAYGYAVYRIFRKQKSSKIFNSDLKDEKNLLENSRIRVKFDSETGDICEFYDKESKEYIINKPCRAVILDETHCDTWAHGEMTLGKVSGFFGNPEFEVSENGSVRATLTVKTKYNNSLITRHYSIFPGSGEVRVKTKIDFREKHACLKFSFPIKGESITAEIPYGAIERPLYTGEEPCEMWFSCGNLCVANDSKYAYDSENGEIRLTVLRSAIYADHYGQKYRDNSCEFMEQGEHEFSYSIFPYSGKADAQRRAAELNFGLRCIAGTFRSGKLPEKMSCFNTDNENIFISAVKRGEDENSDIIRLYNIDDNDFAVAFKWFDSEVKCRFAHNDVKTFDEGGRELNLIEWKE